MGARGGGSALVAGRCSFVRTVSGAVRPGSDQDGISADVSRLAYTLWDPLRCRLALEEC